MNTQAIKLASVLLQYPTTSLFDGLDTLERFAAQTSPKPTRESFGRFLGWLRATRPTTWHSTMCKHSTCAAAAACT
ncbi:hypothetical protein I553_6928 [Mycobacterium xenopi 4042]|uniref:Nitrate reductase delta subunit n=1 Tax=Mycobacterium xenopi 4042 TaxID=1299334 RepID=X7Z3B1_MYCXE|nr:hypothetical protein I553_6928 [Mycobacterium xenopi 4042]